jgi:hypothetical protein
MGVPMYDPGEEAKDLCSLLVSKRGAGDSMTQDTFRIEFTQEFLDLLQVLNSVMLMIIMFKTILS